MCEQSDDVAHHQQPDWILTGLRTVHKHTRTSKSNWNLLSRRSNCIRARNTVRCIPHIKWTYTTRVRVITVCGEIDKVSIETWISLGQWSCRENSRDYLCRFLCTKYGFNLNTVLNWVWFVCIILFICHVFVHFEL